MKFYRYFKDKHATGFLYRYDGDEWQRRFTGDHVLANAWYLMRSAPSIDVLIMISEKEAFLEIL